MNDIQKKRILITGRNSDLVLSLYPVLETKYQLASCRAEKNEFIDAFHSFYPHLVLVCMRGENDGDFGVYKALRYECGAVETPVLAAGNDEEKSGLIKALTDNNVFFLNEPFTSEYLFTRISDVLFNCDTSDINVYHARELVVEDVPEQKKLPVIRKPNIILLVHTLSELKLLRSALSPKYNVVAVSDAELAFKELKNGFRADAILLDYSCRNTPSAPDFLDALKKNKSYADIPTLILMNLSDPSELDKRFRNPPDGYYLKPLFRSYNFSMDYLKGLDQKVIDVLLTGPRRLRAKLPDKMYE